ncbi:putative Cytochrome b561 family protein [Thiomonas arsenitoxydans]|uniref:Cytochrome b561 family protein n=1 Tax=Thiomonas arsenitoxydans (strain DSM 22701 / CIP 110005 / 3As) TaxID=426114 RepID=D6CVM8_THIA3|nr:cytochrome b/b6 domain-containing protein [Thiomonas arsenitoxydans]CAZ86809.1 putative Cytochrome b561 family protein [Thiomonas arsenitoxydans]CQR28360.1 putative Cytochrome b561 family protein [Thiomonas arsenitoxydans]CQR28517.1 putative Cytochrome b561 family protein [Thiomonas arsenitoxydans]CQR28519.1 putative Cytochrome b561 family protein [Thiomonas arsenitoxydans]CQR30828.1 putative Cytochrome b561 family protein [Thiomonas arsenitoxydans]
MSATADAERVPLAIRLFHWALAAAFIGAWALEADWRAAHEWLGYAAAALVVWRLAYAWRAPADWRWRALLHPPRKVLRHAARLARGRAELAAGYNPIAAWNVLAMFAMLLAIAASGWALTTDRYWGDQTLQALHAALVDLMGWLVGFHLLGVAVGSLRARGFLPRSMLDGRRLPH